MEQVEKPAPTPSRTLRVPQGGYDEKKYDYSSTLNGNVYFITFDTIEDAVKAYQQLKEDKVPVRYHVYSLFVKFDEELDNDKLSELVNTNLDDKTKNVTYTRVDPSNHTGKVVVDRLEDCKTLLAYRDSSNLRLRFYRFDPKKAIKRMESPSEIVRKNVKSDDGFVRVQHKSRKTGLFKNTSKYEPKSKSKTNA